MIYDDQVEAIQREIGTLKRRMELVYDDLVKAFCESLASWYEAEMREAVREQYERSRELGAEGMIDLKNRFSCFLIEAKSIATKKLADPRYWSHMAKEGTAEQPIQKAVYSLRQDGSENPLGQVLAELYGKLGEFLRDNGYQMPKGKFKAAGGRPKPEPIIYTKPIQGTPRLISTLEMYSALHQELVEKTGCLCQLNEARARDEVEALWDNAFTLSTSQSINWEQAWEDAEQLASDYASRHDSWGDQYLNWLLDTSPNEGQDSFECFLRSTNKVEKYQMRMRQLWKVALIRTVQKQLRKRELDQATARAIDEQLQDLNPENDYSAYDYVLDDAVGRTCHECREYCEYGTCEACSKCELCCKCNSISMNM